MARRSPVPPGVDPREHPALKGGHVVILSGEKPIFKQHMKGPQGHAALGQVLHREGFDYEPVHGKYAGEKQPGYIVHVKDDSEVEKLKGIAKRMGQEAIVHSQGGKHQYVYTAGDNEGQATQPAVGVQWFGDDEPEDNYSTLYGASGEPLGHFSYAMDFDSPLVQHGRGSMVDVPEAAKMVLKSAVETYRGILLDLRKREVEKVAKKYEVESRKNVARGAKPVSNDISAQGFAGKPSNPNPHNIASGSKVAKSVESEDAAQVRRVREREDAELASIPLADPNKPRRAAPTGPVPNVGETRKTETPMKLHDLMKSQALKKAQCTCGKPGCMWCSPKATKPADTKKGEGGFQPTNAFSIKLKPSGASAPAASPQTSPAAAAAKETFTQRAGTPSKPDAFKSEESPAAGDHGPRIVKNSIFKKVGDFSKAETNASISQRRNGGHIKLGKQEFYIDLKNASDPKKRLKETNPVKESVVPGGKETGWQTDGPKPEVVERSASGGAISANKPKPGPDQKNTAENSVVEGNPGKKAAPKNDLIEKAAEEFHKRTGKPRIVNGKEHTQGQDMLDVATQADDLESVRTKEKERTVLGKAAGTMSAPKPPSAPGAGSPTLSSKPPAKPPQAAVGANPMGKALMPFSAQNQAQALAIGAQVQAAPRAQPKPPSAYDPSLYQPQGPVRSGLMSAADLKRPETMAGVGVTPQPAKPLARIGLVRSPAMVKGIVGFSKSEMCKACGKMHKAGQCL